MGISDLYMSVGQKRSISHFANIVRIAKSDQNISPEEVEMLSKIGRKYNITNEQFKQILKEPDQIPTIAHLECEERVERLYELLQMVEADHRIEKSEVSMLKKIVAGLAFPIHAVDDIVEQAVKTDLEVTDLDEFKRDMFKLMKIRF
jgi:uncharacterized tellurite resistance protein B-like protein